MRDPSATKRILPAYGWAGAALLALGQTLTLVHLRPLSDYWYGFCLATVSSSPATPGFSADRAVRS